MDSSRLRNKNIYSCFAEYDFLLGWSYENGENGYAKDYYKAIDFYLTACLHDNVEGCNNLANIYEKGKIGKKNYKDALYYFEKACNLNDKNGCSNLGRLYYSGRGVSKDLTKAKFYYNKSCSLGDEKACKMKFNNNSSGLKILYDELCHRGNGFDCYTVGSYFEKGGNGYARNYTQAKTYYDKACNLKNKEGCHALGMLFVEGMGVSEDLNTAKFYLKKACDLGKSESCVFFNELRQ
jgi:TPR repeat protein